MKNKFFKRIMSLVLVVVMAVSTMAVSAFSASAATNIVSYDIVIYKAQGEGRTNDIEKMTIVGEKGEMSMYIPQGNVINVVKLLGHKHEDIGAIKEIKVKNYGCDGSFIKYVDITANGKKTTIYGGSWYDNSKTVTFKPSDNVIKFDIKTSNIKNADTNEKVYLTLTDESGNKFTTTNLNEFYDEHRRDGRDFGFMQGKTTPAYIRVPDTFGKVVKIEPSVKNDLFTLGGDWHLASIKATTVSGANTGYSKTFNFNCCIKCK